MARRLTKKLVHFHGDRELVNVQHYLVGQIEASYPWDSEGYAAASRNLSGPRKLAGKLPQTPGAPVTWDDLRLWPVERTIKVVSTPNPHVCDWRCEGAYRTSECRCSCNGRNHGRKFQCEAA